MSVDRNSDANLLAPYPPNFSNKFCLALAAVLVIRKTGGPFVLGSRKLEVPMGPNEATRKNRGVSGLWFQMGKPFDGVTRF